MVSLILREKVYILVRDLALSMTSKERTFFVNKNQEGGWGYPKS